MKDQAGTRDGPGPLTTLTRRPPQLIKKLSATPILPSQNETAQRVTLGPVDSQAALQANKATFFFQLVCSMTVFLLARLFGHV